MHIKYDLLTYKKKLFKFVISKTKESFNLFKTFLLSFHKLNKSELCLLALMKLVLLTRECKYKMLICLQAIPAGCFGLAYWQYQRLHWKLNLIKETNRKIRETPPLPLPIE